MVGKTGLKWTVAVMGSLMAISLGIVGLNARGLLDTLKYPTATAQLAASPGRAIRTFYYAPPDWKPESGRILVLLHGADRRPALMLDIWRKTAIQQNVLLIAPEFSQRAFPGIESYNLGGTLDASGKLSKRQDWSFTALDEAVDSVRQAVGARRRNYVLYGFSAGAQFAIRNLLLTGAPRAELVIASSSGWYTMPTSAPWPCGLGGTDISADAALARPLAIQIGQLDTNANDDFGDAGFEACARTQGRTRLERAEAFFKVGREAARQRAASFAWTLDKVADAAHSTEAHADDAARWLVRF